MKITVRSFAMIRESMGSKDIIIEIDKEKTVLEVLNLIATKFINTQNYLYENNKIKSNILIMVNEDKIDPTNYSVFTLKEDDNLIIIPPAGGG